MAGRVLVLNGLTTTTVELEIWTAVLSLDATVVGVVLVYLALDALDLILEVRDVVAGYFCAGLSSARRFRRGRGGLRGSTGAAFGLVLKLFVGTVITASFFPLGLPR
jgi:hypothetical protein